MKTIPQIADEIRRLENGAGALPAWARASQISELKKVLAAKEEEVEEIISAENRKENTMQND